MATLVPDGTKSTLHLPPHSPVSLVTCATAPKPKQGHSVFECNTDESQCLRRLGSQPAASRCHVALACPPQEPHGGMAERCHHWREVATAHLRAVCIAGHIAYPVRRVLNRPRTSHQLQHSTRCRPLGAQTGDARDHFDPFCARFFGEDMPPHCEHG